MTLRDDGEMDVAPLQPYRQLRSPLLDQVNLDAGMTFALRLKKIREQIFNHLRSGADPQQDRSPSGRIASDGVPEQMPRLDVEAGARLVEEDEFRPAGEGKRHGQPTAFASRQPAGLTLGVSTHDDEELARGLAARPDYVALGPIFPTTLKSMRFAPQGIPKIAAFLVRRQR